MSGKFLSLMALMLATACHAQPTRTSGCLDIREPRARITLNGTLRSQLFAGPPNFESIANGDAEERVFILELPNSICLNDGGEFADPEERVVTAHIVLESRELRSNFSAAVGQQIEVGGTAFAAHTGHHHAPLVVMADRVSIAVRNAR